MPPPARAPRQPFDLRQQLGVETPEHVLLSFDLAGLGTRAAAAIFDLLLLGLINALVLVFAAAAGFTESWESGLGSWGTAIVVLLYLGANLVYLHLIPISQMKNAELVAADSAQLLFGTAGVVAVSTAGYVRVLGKGEAIISATVLGKSVQAKVTSVASVFGSR